ncbi:MAG: ABC transporter ATP-binding protein [Candidatus Helarchaeota archaeon]|nr:ABC transporter ATP-binding protein [Candidatus Helarchaeota archaeon]
MSTFSMVLKYPFKSKPHMICAITILSTATFINLMIPRYTEFIINNLITPNFNFTFNTLIGNIISMIILAILVFTLTGVARYFLSIANGRSLYYLRKDIYGSINKQSFSYFDKNETGQLISRATSDVEQTTRMFGFGFSNLIRTTILLGGLLIAVNLLDMRLAWIFWLVIPITFFYSFILARKIRPYLIRSRQSFGEITNIIHENIIGADVVKIFNNQDSELKKFDINNRDFLIESKKAINIRALLLASNIMIVGVLTILTIYFGGLLVISGSMRLGKLIAFQSYTLMVSFPLNFIGNILVIYIQAEASLTRVKEVIESVPDIKENINPISIEKLEGNVIFDNVSFGYTSNKLILKDINFHIPPSTTVAIIGTSGSGKSTFINLLPRFYDVNEGQIIIDGINVKDYNLGDLRIRIGIVSQETFLFNRSIHENITLGREGQVSMEEVIEAAKIAQIHDFIMSLPNQYETLVGERGIRLSGGQKQRVTIARALIIKPDILILDDVTSSVDVETEFNLQKSLESLIRDRTTFIITQRLSTIRNADLIIILDNGRIIGSGPHETLLRENSFYQQIYSTLYSKRKNIQNKEIPKKDDLEVSEN